MRTAMRQTSGLSIKSQRRWSYIVELCLIKWKGGKKEEKEGVKLAQWPMFSRVVGQSPLLSG